MPDTIQTTTQVSFGGGLNAGSSPHLVGESEVQSSTNVDYTLTMGAASARRGSTLFGKIINVSSATGSKIYAITRNYGLSTGTWNDSAIPWYILTPDGQNYQGTRTVTGTLTFAPFEISPGTGTPNIIPQFTQWEGYIYLANGNNAYRANGTQVYSWLLPQADTPQVTFVQQWQKENPFIGFAGTAGPGTYTATEGTIVGTSTTTAFGSFNPIILATCSSGTGTRIILTGTISGTNTNWESPWIYIGLPTGTGATNTITDTTTVGGYVDLHQGWPNGDTTGATGSWTATATITQTATVGNYGVDYILLALMNQQNIVTVQRDLSVGDATFTNYWHLETTADDISDVTYDPLSALLTANNANTIEIQTQAFNLSRATLPHISQKGGVGLPGIRRNVAKTSVSASVSPWGVSRTDYQFIGPLSAPDFSNIQAIRVIIEFNTSGQEAVIGGCVTFGNSSWSLNDQISGISYFQTFARVEENVIVAEGAASLPSPPQLSQFASTELQCAAEPAGGPAAGVTHRVFYRTGGLLSDAYRIGSCTILSGTSQIFDYNLPDMLVINNPSLKRFLWSQWPSPSAGTGLPGVNAVSQPWQSRVWIGVENQLYWSWPGEFEQIQDNSQTSVSDTGDNISAIIPGANLVIVNQASVYEMSGSVFEGTAQNWSLSRSLARRGSVAPRTAINTPYGIILFSWDGMSFYRQGFGFDQELQWIYDKIGDIWKGMGTSDPAALKGRVPAINQQCIFNSIAAYKDERLYLAVPTGQSVLANTVFVMDMAHQTVFMYTYPWNICSLFVDRVSNRLMAGTDKGVLMQMETGLTDTTTSGVPAGVAWSFTTREWSSPVDTLWENLQVEAQGTATWIAAADATNTYILTTAILNNKGWNPASLQGSVGDNLNFILQGTQSGTQQSVFELQWDSIPEAKKVTYFHTDPIAIPSENYVKTWLADLNVFTGTMTGSVLVDGTVVQTAIFISSNTLGDLVERRVFEVGMSNVTYGKNVTAIYANGSHPFRHYSTQFEFEPKPFGKMTWLVTYKKAGGASQADMARFYSLDIEGTALTTVTNSWLIDGSVFSTNTFVFGSNEFYEEGEGTDSGEEGNRIRNYMDWIPFPPGGRGYLFQQQMTGTNAFMVWRASLDFDRMGVKGLSRVTANGSPSPGSEK